MTMNIEAADTSRSCTGIATVPGKEAAAKALPEPRARRLALLVVLIASAAVTGAMAGALAAARLMRPPADAPDPAPVVSIYETRVLQGAITVLRSDLAAFKSSVKADAEATNAQLAKLGDRFDRADRLQAARETTGTLRRCRSSAKDGSCMASAMARSRTAPTAAARAPQRGGIF